jgi:hypothetical protein
MWNASVLTRASTGILLTSSSVSSPSNPLISITAPDSTWLPTLRPLSMIVTRGKEPFACALSVRSSASAVASEATPAPTQRISV